VALAAAKAYAHADELILEDAPLSVVKSDVRSAGLGPPRSSLLTAPARPRRRRGPWELNLLRQAAYTFEDSAAADRVTPRGAASDRVTKMREALATCAKHVGSSSPELAPLLCELACAIVQHAESCEAMAEAVTLGSRAAACLTASRSQGGDGGGVTGSVAVSGESAVREESNTPKRDEGGEEEEAAYMEHLAALAHRRKQEAWQARLEEIRLEGRGVRAFSDRN